MLVELAIRWSSVMRGPELKGLRQQAGYKAFEFAHALGITPATLSRYERDRAEIPRAIKLAAKYLTEPLVAPRPATERLVEALKEVVAQ